MGHGGWVTKVVHLEKMLRLLKLSTRKNNNDVLFLKTFPQILSAGFDFHFITWPMRQLAPRHWIEDIFSHETLASICPKDPML